MASQLISKHSDDESWITLRPCVKRMSLEQLQESKAICNRLRDGILPRIRKTTKPADVHGGTITGLAHDLLQNVDAGAFLIKRAAGAIKRNLPVLSKFSEQILQISPRFVEIPHILEIRSYLIHSMRNMKDNAVADVVLQLIQLLLEASYLCLVVQLHCST